MDEPLSNTHSLTLLLILNIVLFLPQDTHTESLWITRYFAPRDGLAYQVVRDVEQSSNGVMWFATWGGGLSRYDGSNWETFTTKDGLVSNWIRSLAMDSNDGLWIGTSRGISYFDGEQWTNYTKENTPSLSHDSVFKILIRKNGQVWFGMSDGYLYAHNPSTGEWQQIRDPIFFDHEFMKYIIETDDHNIWIKGKEWRSFDGEKWEFHTDLPEISYISFHNNRLIALGKESFEAHDDFSLHIFQYPFVDSIKGFIQTENDELIVGSNKGVRIYQNNKWSFFNLLGEISHPYVEVIKSFEDGSIWIGTRNGIFLIRKSDWERFIFPSNVFDFKNFHASPNDEPILLQNNGSFMSFQDGEWKIRRETNQNDLPDLEIISRNDTNFFVQNLKTISEYQWPSCHLIRSITKPVEDKTDKTFISSNGDIYIYGERGVIYWNGAEWRPFQETGAIFTHVEIELILETKDGSRWVVTDENGTFRSIKGKNWQKVYVPDYTGRRITDLCVARDGSVWYATSGNGIYVEKDGIFHSFTTRNGLPNDWINCLYEAEDGTIWAGTEDSTTASYRNGRWITFTQKDMHLNGRIEGIFEYPKGRIWFVSSIDGVACYTPSTEAPDTFIQDYTAELTPSGIGVFTFTGRDVWHNTHTNELVYSWRILDAHRKKVIFHWTDFLPMNTITTPPLSAGDYVFEVRAADKERNVDLSPAWGSFMVEQFFFLKPVFWLPFTISLLLVVVLLVAWRKKHFALLENERWLSQAQHIAHVGHWVADIQHNRFIGSDEFKNITGISTHSVYDTIKSYLRKIYPKDREYIHHVLRNILEKNSVRRFEHGIFLPGGEGKIIRSQHEIEYNEAGHPVRIMGTLQDVTEMRRLEGEAQKNKMLESLGILAGGIAHDFNNLLMAIIGNINLAKSSTDSQSKQYKQLLAAEEASMKANELTKRLITFSEGSAPNLQTHFIAPIVQQAADTVLSKTQNIHLKIESSDDIQPALLDESQITQVMHNILLNAVEAMPKGGQIHVRFENLTIKDDTYLMDGHYVKTVIQDEGCGIPVEYLPKIFDPYFTTKDNVTQKGLGLGLAICFSIIKQHKGKIEVDSHVGHGTTVTLYFHASST